jgi:hypothetical protein
MQYKAPGWRDYRRKQLLRLETIERQEWVQTFRYIAIAYILVKRGILPWKPTSSFLSWTWFLGRNLDPSQHWSMIDRTQRAVNFKICAHQLVVVQQEIIYKVLTLSTAGSMKWDGVASQESNEIGSERSSCDHLRVPMLRISAPIDISTRNKALKIEWRETGDSSQPSLDCLSWLFAYI